MFIIPKVANVDSMLGLFLLFREISNQIIDLSLILCNHLIGLGFAELICYKLRDNSQTAAWPSGKAEDCKSFIPSSNLGAAFKL
ncbi:hypothetical protein PMYN1_Chma555 (chromatophore) [Paulinella micropora]|uniref:Uncharacterized protein n=1 Tax=Paulinella micropora TaxID=1928728 RepID=A0A5K7W659_9EUKA|nr:hypothetical protein PMYN1_Chma555 [Paulinella micropora]